VIRYYFNYKYF